MAATEEDINQLIRDFMALGLNHRGEALSADAIRKQTWYPQLQGLIGKEGEFAAKAKEVIGIQSMFFDVKKLQEAGVIDGITNPDIKRAAELKLASARTAGVLFGVLNERILPFADEHRAELNAATNNIFMYGKADPGANPVVAPFKDADDITARAKAAMEVMADKAMTLTPENLRQGMAKLDKVIGELKDKPADAGTVKILSDLRDAIKAKAKDKGVKLEGEPDKEDRGERRTRTRTRSRRSDDREHLEPDVAKRRAEWKTRGPFKDPVKNYENAYQLALIRANRQSNARGEGNIDFTAPLPNFASPEAYSGRNR